MSANAMLIVKVLLLVMAALSVPRLTSGQDSVTHVWSKSFGSTSADWPQAVVLDHSGNVIVTGCLSGTIDFGGGPLTSAGQCDIFAAKFSADGAHLWSKRFGGSASDYGWSAAVDNSGDVLVSGWFDGSVDFGGGSLNGPGGFVAKLSGADGSHLWSERFGGADTIGRGIAVDAKGDVLVTGNFFNTVDFGGGTLVSAGGSDIFVAKFSGTNGGYLWAKRFGGEINDIGWAIAVDSAGDAVVTGRFGKADFGGGLLVSAGEYDIFVAKLAGANGGHIWSKRYGSTLNDFGNGIAVDSAGDVVLTGLFRGTVDLGGGPLTSAGGDDIFVAAFSGIDGSHLWSKRFGSTGSDFGNSVTTGSDGTVAVTGQFYGSVDFGGGPLTSAGMMDVFVAEFSGANGEHRWSKRFGNAEQDYGQGVALDAGGNVVVAGSFCITVDFGGGALASTGSYDIFVLKLASTAPVAQATVSTTAVNFGNQFPDTESAPYVVTLTNSGSLPLQVLGITVSGEFTVASSCGSELAPGAHCPILVCFHPSSWGARSGQLTIAHSAAGSPHAIALSGTGADVVLSLARPGRPGRVSQGTARLTVTSQSRSDIRLACFDAPSGTQCSVAPDMMRAGVDAQTVSVSLTAQPGASDLADGDVYLVRVEARSPDASDSIDVPVRLGSHSAGNSRLQEKMEAARKRKPSAE